MSKGRPLNDETKVLRQKLSNAIAHFEFLYSNIKIPILEWVLGRTLVMVELHYGGNPVLAYKTARRLFGYSQCSGGKVYYYDGVMMKWNNGRKEPRIWFMKLSDGIYIMTEDDWNFIRDHVLDDLIKREDDETGKDKISVRVREVKGLKDDYLRPNLVGSNREYVPGKQAKCWKHKKRILTEVNEF
jgi:hypothetical protein